MFRFIVVLATLLVVAAFSPAAVKRTNVNTVSMVQPSKIFTAAVIASSVMVSPVLAKEGAGAKFGFFGSDVSSPFTVNEDREDPMFSPYSPYGDGSAAVYNKVKGDAAELKFWTNQFKECEKRTLNVPKFAEKKQWMNVRTELTSFAYNYRESLNRLAEVSSDPAAAKKIVRAYNSDINDIFEAAIKKDSALVSKAYDASVKELASFKALLK